MIENYSTIISLCRLLRHQCGLLFTNESEEEIVKYFEDHEAPDFARTGAVAEQTVVLEEGKLLLEY